MVVRSYCLVCLVPVWLRMMVALTLVTSAGMAVADPLPPSAEFGVGLTIRDEPADMVVDGDGRVVVGLDRDRGFF